MNEVIKNLVERRSVRNYQNKQVAEASLQAILAAGTYAPSGMGWQSTIMVVLQAPEVIAAVSKLNSQVMNSDSDPFYGAPTVIVVLADRTVSTYVEDGSLVMGNLLNAAYSEGVDSCWIHRAKETFATPKGKALLKQWGIDEKYVGIGNCILGYRDGDLPKANKRKDNFIYRI